MRTAARSLLVSCLLASLPASAWAQGLTKVDRFKSGLVTATLEDVGDKVEIEFETPPNVHATLLVDVNGNGAIDPRVDTYYAVSSRAAKEPCTGFLLSAEAATPCGTMVSEATFRVQHGATWVLHWTIPKSELTSKGPPIRFIVELYDERKGTKAPWSFFPSGAERTFAQAFEWGVPPKPEAPQPAKLRLKTTPGGVQAYLDDAYKGTTSDDEGVLVIEGLAPGEHKLRLSRAGYKETREVVVVAAGETRPLTLALAEAGPKPLSVAELEEMLKSGVPEPRVRSFVSQYGVDFSLTSEIEQRLRAAGAGAELMLAILKGKK